jgi:hypothetical protein
MDDLTIQTLIQAKYSGSMSELSVYLNLTIQTAAVLVGGIVIWRASSVLHKKKQAQRAQNTYFETPYSKGWKRK